MLLTGLQGCTHAHAYTFIHCYKSMIAHTHTHAAHIMHLYNKTIIRELADNDILEERLKVRVTGRSDINDLTFRCDVIRLITVFPWPVKKEKRKKSRRLLRITCKRAGKREGYFYTLYFPSRSVLGGRLAGCPTIVQAKSAVLITEAVTFLIVQWHRQPKLSFLPSFSALSVTSWWVQSGSVSLL